MSREAVLLQWERKIEVAERLDAGERVEPAERRDSDERRAPNGRRFARTEDEAASSEDSEAHGTEAAELVTLRPVEDAPAPRRFVRAPDQGATQSPPEPLAERRTVKITGQPTPERRRRAVVDSQLAQPDRVALWAFLLGLLLVAVAAGTAHA